jgi:hypothetical protein
MSDRKKAERFVFEAPVTMIAIDASPTLVYLDHNFSEHVSGHQRTHGIRYFIDRKDFGDVRPKDATLHHV